MSESLYHLAEEQLREHALALEAEFNNQVPRAGAGVRIQGRWPVVVVSPVESDPDVLRTELDYQLKPWFGSDGIHFSRGKLDCGGTITIPTVNGYAAGDPLGLLPRLPNGGQIYAQYLFYLVFAGGAWTDDFISCQLVQVALDVDPPAPTMPTEGVGGSGVAYLFLMSYNAQGEVLTFGQNSVLLPDPDDLHPSDTVGLVKPQWRYG